MQFFIVLNWNAPQSLDSISKWRPSDSAIHTQIMQGKIILSSAAQSLCKTLINNRQSRKVAVNEGLSVSVRERKIIKVYADLQYSTSSYAGLKQNKFSTHQTWLLNWSPANTALLPKVFLAVNLI